MGNPIEDGMSDWHDRFGVPASQSDKQFYKDLGDKYNYPNYGQRTDHNFKARFKRDEEAYELLRNYRYREYFELRNQHKLDDARSGKRYYRDEYIELIDTTGEHTSAGRWGFIRGLRRTQGSCRALKGPSPPKFTSTAYLLQQPPASSADRYRWCVAPA